MNLASQPYEPLGWRAARWGGAMIGALLFHGGVIAIAMLLATLFAEPEEGGIVNIDLPPIAAEPTTSEAENAENPQDDVTTPAPAEGPKIADDPAEDATEAEPQPVEEQAAIEPQQEPAPETPPVPDDPAVQPEPMETAEEPAPVEEAPLAPEPEVTLPKSVVAKPKPVAPKRPVEPKERPAEKKAKKPETEPKEKRVVAAKQKAAKSGQGGTTPGSNAKGKATAAAASGEQFSSSPISRPQPPYPSGARASRIEGSVTVSMTIAPSGAVTSVSIVSATPAGVFNSTVTSTLRQWRFKPSASGGRKTQTVRFKLK